MTSVPRPTGGTSYNILLNMNPLDLGVPADSSERNTDCMEKKTWPGEQQRLRDSPDPVRIPGNAPPAFGSDVTYILQEDVYDYSIDEMIFNAKFIFIT